MTATCTCPPVRDALVALLAGQPPVCPVHFSAGQPTDPAMPLNSPGIADAVAAAVGATTTEKGD